MDLKDERNYLLWYKRFRGYIYWLKNDTSFSNAWSIYTTHSVPNVKKVGWKKTAYLWILKTAYLWILLAYNISLNITSHIFEYRIWTTIVELIIQFHRILGEFPQWERSKWHRIRGIWRVRFSFINLYSTIRFDSDVGGKIGEFKHRLPLKHEFHKLKEVYLVTRASRQTESAQKTLHLYTLALSNPTITPTPHQ